MNKEYVFTPKVRISLNTYTWGVPIAVKFSNEVAPSDNNPLSPTVKVRTLEIITLLVSITVTW